MLVSLSQIMRPEISRDSQICKLIFPDICNLLFYHSGRATDRQCLSSIWCCWKIKSQPLSSKLTRTTHYFLIGTTLFVSFMSHKARKHLVTEISLCVKSQSNLDLRLSTITFGLIWQFFYISCQTSQSSQGPQFLSCSHQSPDPVIAVIRTKQPDILIFLILSLLGLTGLQVTVWVKRNTYF